MLSPSQASKIIELAHEAGLQKYKDGKYATTSGNTTDVKKLFRILDFPEVFKNHRPLLTDAYMDFNSIRNEVIQLLRDEFEEGGTDYGGEESGREFNSKLAKLIPVVNVAAKNKTDMIMLVDPETKRPVYDINVDIYLLRTNQKDSEILSSRTATSIVPRFDPYSLDSMVTRSHKYLNVDILHLNTYVPPKWRFVHAKPKFEGFIKTLIDHLFPIPEEREDVLDWLHYAITRRNGTVLCLAGPRGTGKSLLMQIMSYLVGEEYAEVVNKEILEDKFNSAFKNKRLIIFEEVEVSDSVALNKLKSWGNDRIVLEQKGEDSQTIDNFTSMSILLNDISQLKIQPQERRFSVPQVAELDLRTVIPEIEIQEFADSMSQDDMFTEIAEFGEHLLARRPNRSYMYAIKNDYYYLICSLGLREWQSFLIDYLLQYGEEGVTIPTKKIQQAFKAKYKNGDKETTGVRFPDRGSMFESFLKDYKHRGECFIGRLSKVEDNGHMVNAILPDPDFLYKFQTPLVSTPVESGINAESFEAEFRKENDTALESL